jgi:tryptophanyl-tRNA synthetase
MKTFLTGVKPTGLIHIGNLLGAIRPALAMVNETSDRSLFFIADYHALTFINDAQALKKITYEVAAAWLAFGLDPKKTIIYRQSDIPEIFELSWILACMSPKGLMNRAHAYKARVAENLELGREDLDHGINMGVFTYPILMAADILLFRADTVPVGEDQVQHVEIARDLAQKFNNVFKKEVLKAPQYSLNKAAAILPGLDGRKMSKSYDNTIPAFCDSAQLKKLVGKIKTDSSLPTEPKDPNTSLLFDIYKQFAEPSAIEAMRAKYSKGVGWGEVKGDLHLALDKALIGPREVYNQWLADIPKLEAVLQDGAKRARELARETIKDVHAAIGKV